MSMPKWRDVGDFSKRRRILPCTGHWKPARDADWVGALPRDWRILHRPDNDVEAEIARIGAYSVLRAKERIAAGERIGAAGVLIALLRDAVDVYRRELRNATGAAA